MSEYRIGRLTRTRTDGSTYWSFCVSWHTAEGRKRYSLDTTDQIAAEAAARKLWAILQQRGPLETVGQIVEAYLDSLDGARDEARKRYRWKQLTPYWAGLRPSAIDEEVSKSYITWRNRSINSIRNELGLVRSAMRWGMKEGHVDKMPPIIIPAMPESRVEHLTKTQFRQFLLGCAAPHVKLFAMLAVTTGARKTALLEAKWDQVDLDRGLLSLNALGRTQNSKHRATVPLNDLILPALREARKAAVTEYVIEHHGKPLLDIKKGIAAAAQRSGVRVHPHMFRHSAAVWMAEDRVPMAEIASFLGHKDIGTTSRVYAKYHPDYLREAARSLTW